MRPEADEPRRRRLRFAALAGAFAVVLLVGGIAAARAWTDGIGHTLGVTGLGYGIGIGVAAVFIASGVNPLRRK